MGLELESKSVNINKSLVYLYNRNANLWMKDNKIKIIIQVELNADILSEMIVDDLTQEVAQDLSRLALDEDVEQEARLMQEAPSLERIIQRLHEMEVRRIVYRITCLGWGHKEGCIWQL